MRSSSPPPLFRIVIANLFHACEAEDIAITGEGVRILRSPMWEPHPEPCTNVIVRGVRISTHGPNNNGRDPEACKGPRGRTKIELTALARPILHLEKPNS